VKAKVKAEGQEGEKKRNPSKQSSEGGDEREASKAGQPQKASPGK